MSRKSETSSSGTKSFLTSAKIKKDEIIGYLEEAEVLTSSTGFDIEGNEKVVRKVQPIELSERKTKSLSITVNSGLPPHLLELYSRSIKDRNKEKQRVIKDVRVLFPEMIMTLDELTYISIPSTLVMLNQ